MYAIIKTGGKQYRVQKGQIIDVELLQGDEAGVKFEEVLFLNNGTDSIVGEPTVSGCTVMGEKLGTVKGPKIDTLKYKRRKNNYRHWGHRQQYTRVRITDINS